jgi:single-stranded DNA-binding protein
MSDLNRVTLSGRLVDVPELKFLPSGTAVARIRLACHRARAKDGARQDEATFVDVEVYGKSAEALADTSKRGRSSWRTGGFGSTAGKAGTDRSGRASPSWRSTSASDRIRMRGPRRHQPSHRKRTGRTRCRFRAAAARDPSTSHQAAMVSGPPRRIHPRLRGPGLTSRHMESQPPRETLPGRETTSWLATCSC